MNKYYPIKDLLLDGEDFFVHSKDELEVINQILFVRFTMINAPVRARKRSEQKLASYTNYLPTVDVNAPRFNNEKLSMNFFRRVKQRHEELERLIKEYIKPIPCFRRVEDPYWLWFRNCLYVSREFYQDSLEAKNIVMEKFKQENFPKEIALDK